MRPMYYQPDLSHANRLFRVFLMVSILVHAGILFYQRTHNTFTIAGLDPNLEQSFQVRLQERLRPRPKVQPRPIKRVIEKSEKKVTKKVEPQVKPITTEEVATNTPPTKAFESSIKDYVSPHYPRIALRRGITGVVRLTIWVKGSGEIDKIVLAESSGHSSLDNSALDAAKQWKFKQLSSNSQQLYKLSKTVVYKIN